MGPSRVERALRSAPVFYSVEDGVLSTTGRGTASSAALGCCLRGLPAPCVLWLFDLCDYLVVFLTETVNSVCA